MGFTWEDIEHVVKAVEAGTGVPSFAIMNTDHLAYFHRQSGSSLPPEEWLERLIDSGSVERMENGQFVMHLGKNPASPQ